jgi:hypothetical protein
LSPEEEVNTITPFLFLQEMGFHFLWAIMAPSAFKKKRRADTSMGENQNGRIVKKEMGQGGTLQIEMGGFFLLNGLNR